MAELPLHDASPAHSDAWHRVRSPGGYEWWHFDAEDVAGRYRVVATFFDGFPFHPQYVRRYQLFQETPTQVRPPLPSEYRCVCFSVYDGPALLSQFSHQYLPEQFVASAERPEVTVGPNKFHVATDGAIHLHVAGVPWEPTWQGPRLLDGEQLAADLTFRPVGLAVTSEHRVLATDPADPGHRWIVAAPRCEVEGTIRIGGESRDAIAISLAFNGTGYHDHQYGVRPIGAALRRSCAGRAILADRTYAFQIGCGKDSTESDQALLLRSDRHGTVEAAQKCTAIDWSGGSTFGLAFPRKIEFGNHLKLSNPRVADSSPVQVRVIYDAEADGVSQPATAFVQVVHPPRLTWPLVGGMVEKSISRPPVPSSSV